VVRNYVWFYLVEDVGTSTEKDVETSFRNMHHR